MTSEYLSPGELHTLTGLARSATQSDWLKNKSIPFLLDGKRVIVSREHVRARIEGKDVSGLKIPEWRDYLLLPDAIQIERGESHPTAGSGIYALFGREGILLYIGKTLSLNQRMNQHFWARVIPFKTYAAIEVHDDFVADLEVAHIYALKPPCNSLYERVRTDNHDDMVAAITAAWEQCLENAV